MLITEWEFKILEDFPSKLICNDGNIYNLKNGKKYKLKPSFGKYLRLRIFKNGKETYKWVHRLVYHAFIGNPKGLEIHHKDLNPTNNHYLNLEGLLPDKHRKYHRFKKKEEYCPF